LANLERFYQIAQPYLFSFNPSRLTVVKMTLRSRKTEAKAAETRRKEDMELQFQQLNQKADEPLLKLQVQTVKFNYMWKDMIMKLSFLLVPYSFLFIYKYKDDYEVVGFHMLSALVFGLTGIWVKEVEENGFEKVSMGIVFRASVLSMLSQVLIYFHILLYSTNEDLKYRCAPMSAFYFLLVCLALRMMRRNSQKIATQREKIQAEIRSKEH